MRALKQDIDESQYYDPVFLAMGQKVYSNERIQELRNDNLEKKRKGRRIYNLIPQEGFQEKVLLTDADIKIIGGKRGGGKMQPVDNLIVTPFGMRRMGDLEVGDIITNPTTGGMQRVLQIFEHYDKDVYKVYFSDGAYCECGVGTSVARTQNEFFL